MSDLEPWEIEGIEKMRKLWPNSFAFYTDELLRAAYRRYCQITLSANWLETTPETLNDFYVWAFSTNLDLIRKEMRQNELTRP